MKIEGNDIQANPWRKPDDAAAVQQAAEQSRQTSNRAIVTRVRAADTVEARPDAVATYDRHSRVHVADHRDADRIAAEATARAAAAEMVRGGGGEVALFANVAGVWSDFASIGLVPPPQRFAGIDVVTPSDLRDPLLSDDGNGRASQVTPSDRVQMMVIRDILQRIASAETSEAEKQALAAQLGPQAQAVVARSESSDSEEEEAGLALNVSL